jgi:hypothetical protein
LTPDTALAVTQFNIGIKHAKIVVSSLDPVEGPRFQRTRELIKSLEAQFQTDVRKK